MKTVLLALALVLQASPASAIRLESEGGGVKNGGSAYRCDGEALVTAETALAVRFAPILDLADRELFFAAVEAKIQDPTFRRLLRKYWTQFGDSDRWPDGNLDQVTVYYYVAPHLAFPYDKQGLLAPMNPQNEVCATPFYEPTDCCTRVLLSYFDPTSRTPTRLARHHRQLTRIQKNVLEIHEAVYRTAWDLADLPPREPVPYAAGEIATYLSARGALGQMPATNVYNTTAQLISAGTANEDVDFAVQLFWTWAYAVKPRR